MKSHLTPAWVFFFITFFINAISNSPVIEAPVPQWLVLGSFQAPGAPDLLAVPYIPEAEAAPSEGVSIGKRTWNKTESPDGSVNFIGMGFPFSANCAAYAFAYMFSEKTVPVKLLLGSDDGIAAWLNGTEVWRHSIQRGHIPREDAAAVRLEKGWNRLLLKISQQEGGWGFSCTIASPAGLRFSVEDPAPDQRTASKSSDEPVLINVEMEADPTGPQVRLKSILYNPAEKKIGLSLKAMKDDSFRESLAALEANEATSAGMTVGDRVGEQLKQMMGMQRRTKEPQE